MAGIGVAYMCFAPIDEETKDKLPTYEAGVEVARMITAADAPNVASGSLWANNREVERKDRVSGTAITMEVDQVKDGAKPTVFGMKKIAEDADTNEALHGALADNLNDVAPYGGLAFYKAEQYDNVTSYRGFFYPKAKATIGQMNAQSESDAINFQTEQVVFNGVAPAFGDWRYQKVFEKEEEAIAFVNALTNMNVVPETPPEG